MHLEHEIRRMAESISGLPRHDSDSLTFADLREAIDAIPHEDAVEWLGMCEILAAEEKQKGVLCPSCGGRGGSEGAAHEVSGESRTLVTA